MTDLELRNLMERLEALTARLEGLTAGSGGAGDAGRAGRAGEDAGCGVGGRRRFTDGNGTSTDGHGARMDECGASAGGSGVSVGGMVPRESAYREALNEAVSVLEATRSSFRSRRLKELRERIEFVLRS